MIATRPRIIFVNRVYPPAAGATGQLLHDLATVLADRGRDVTVVTGGDPQNPQTNDTVNVVRLGGHSCIAPQIGLVGKWRGHRRFASLAKAWLDQSAQKSDTVVIMTDPPSLAGRYVSRPNRAGPHIVYWVQDIHPEIGAALFLPRPLRSIVGRLARARNQAWRRAAAVVTLGEDMAQIIARRGVDADRLHIYPNWAPTWLGPAEESAVTRFRQQQGWSDKFVLMYSGNLGRVHALNGLLNLATSLRTEKRVHFVFVGSGPQFARISEHVRQKRLTNVEFLPAQPRDDLSALLASADLHAVTLRDGCQGLVWPSKFYGILAVARPVLYLGPPEAEIAEIVTREKLGISAPPQGTHAVAEQIRAWLDTPAALLALRARVARYHAAEHSFNHRLELWENLFDSLDAIASSSQPSSPTRP